MTQQTNHQEHWYHVIWEFETRAENPLEAALIVWDMQHSEDSVATVFLVQEIGEERASRVDIARYVLRMRDEGEDGGQE